MASCRACGGELKQIALCPVCEEGVQWKCASCSKDTDVSVHTHDDKTVQPRFDVLPAKERSASVVTTT